MRAITAISVAALLMGGTGDCRAQTSTPPNQAAECVISRVVDGDTVHCRSGLKVRLIGIDAPEMRQGEVGRAARAALLRLTPVGSTVQLEADVSPRDRYGRTLAYIWRGDTLVNEAIIRLGWALRYTMPPDVRYVERFGAAERAARAAKVGMWAQGGLECAPDRFRRGDC